MTGVSRDNTAGEDGDYRVVGDLDYFDENDEEKFRSILKNIMLFKGAGNGVESEEVEEKIELPNEFKEPFDEFHEPADSDETFDLAWQPVDHLTLCRLLGQEPHESLRTCMKCDALALNQCPWA